MHKKSPKLNSFEQFLGLMGSLELVPVTGIENFRTLDFQITKFPGGVFIEKALKRPVENLAVLREDLKKNMNLIERLCKEADSHLSPYLFRAVTEGKSYNTLRMSYSIPCGPDMFYDRYRKFFWLLSQER